MVCPEHGNPRYGKADRHRLRLPMQREGYTLLEVLIAAGILSMLGAALVTVLTQGVSIWRRAENRGRVYEKARVLLDRLANDLRSTVIADSIRDGGEPADGGTWFRFLADHDDAGRQRLRLVRTISGETEHALLREGGKYVTTGVAARYDGKQDAWEAQAGLLAAPGGFEEVFWALDSREGNTTLWRSVRAPIGGLGSLFHDGNIQQSASSRQKTSGKLTAGTERTAVVDTRPPFGGMARAQTDGILFLRFSFWGPTTTTWDPSVLPLCKPRPGKGSGPLFHWDSTRAILDYGGSSGEYTFEAREGSLFDSSDDIFPARVEITLVLGDAGDTVTLSEPITASTSNFLVSRALSISTDPRDRFLRVDDEWMEIESIRGRAVVVAGGGRGARGTAAGGHGRGSLVQMGTTFRRVVEIPGNRGRGLGGGAREGRKSLR